MGNYLYLGIRKAAYTDTRDLKRYDGGIEAYIKELNKSFDKSIYDMKINEESIEIELKKEYSDTEIMKEFLLEQFAKIELTDSWMLDKVENIKKATTEEELIDALELSKDVTNVYLSLDNIAFRPEVKYKVETLAFLHEGKFYLEQYGDLPMYIINTLRNSSKNPLAKSLGFYEC